MFEIEITDGKGRRLASGTSLFDGKSITEQVFGSVERSVRAQRCPVHGKQPTVRRKPGSDELEFDVCCETLRAKAEAKIG
ncbi:MAG TPA: hypothetical protein VH081_05975 [Solirubrobacteraceae bacterium]|jgi:hypothetical protein|nr:hypothetical protein [Solirubrobacteraceae bacterium]